MVSREAETRIRNIFSGPKKRPPVLFLVLMFSVCIFCGNLVACQVAETGGESAYARSAQSGNVSLENQRHQAAWFIYLNGDPPLSETEQTLLKNLSQAADRQNGYQFQNPTIPIQLMGYIQKDGWLLGAVFAEDHLENTLILGIMDKETGEVPHAVFQCSYHAGAPNVVTFQNDQGEPCMLYTLNGQEDGQYIGEAGLVRFDGTDITWAWPVEGDIRDENGAALQTYKDYWTGHLALMAPGGVDIYEANPAFEWGKEEPASMWQVGYDEFFYADPSSATELPMPIYFQSLNWLAEYTNDPGGWRIVSLTLNDERCDPEKQTDCFTLQAREELGTGEMVVDLFFPYETESNRLRIYDKPDRTDVYDSYEAYTKSYVE